MKDSTGITLGWVRGALAAVVTWADSWEARGDGDVIGPKAVYALTNEPTGNRLAVFAREGRGMLTPASLVPTGGLGTGPNTENQGGLAFGDDRSSIYAINPGDGTITVFSVTPAARSRSSGSGRPACPRTAWLSRRTSSTCSTPGASRGVSTPRKFVVPTRCRGAATLRAKARVPQPDAWKTIKPLPASDLGRPTGAPGEGRHRDRIGRPPPVRGRGPVMLRIIRLEEMELIDSRDFDPGVRFAPP
jgi:hypothetical protein